MLYNLELYCFFSNHGIYSVCFWYNSKECSMFLIWYYTEKSLCHVFASSTVIANHNAHYKVLMFLVLLSKHFIIAVYATPLLKANELSLFNCKSIHATYLRYSNAYKYFS